MGRRRANQMAVFFAGLGTLACGFSGNMETLIAARFVSVLQIILLTLIQTCFVYILGVWEGEGFLRPQRAYRVYVSITFLTDAVYRIITSDMYTLRVRRAHLLGRGLFTLFTLGT